MPLKGLVACFCILVLAGCAEQSEEQRVAAFRRSLKYRTYRFASEKGIEVGLTEYRKRGRLPIDAMTAHAFTGILLCLSEKNEYALIEADILEGYPGPEAKVLRLGMRSVAFYRMGYPRHSQLSHEELKSSVLELTGAKPEEFALQQKVFCLGLVVFGLKQRDESIAKLGGDLLTVQTGVDYISPLIASVADVQKGNLRKAVSDVHELAQSDRFSEHARRVAADFSRIVELEPDGEDRAERIVQSMLVDLFTEVVKDVFTDAERSALLDLGTGDSEFGRNQTAQPGATDNPDDAQRLREDH